MATSETPIGERSKALQAIELYIQELRAGNPTQRDAILSEHPELMTMVGMIERYAAGKNSKTQTVGGLKRKGSDKNIVTPAPVSENILAGPQKPIADDQGFYSDFGGYVLLGEIGRGSFGVVYLARQKNLNRLVAVKVIHSDYSASEREIWAFQEEARAVALLNHPNIIQIIGAGEVQGNHYFSMEFVDGEDLESKLELGPFEEAAAVQIMATVARAVDYLHEHGIIHRDLKPSNIIVDREGRPYVTDFGLAKILQPDGNILPVTVVAGTPSYMAPEQVMGSSGKIGAPCDVWGLGAVLYHLLTGRPPFSASRETETLQSVLRENPIAPRQINPKISPVLEWIILKSMEKLPEKRYASAHEFASDLDRFLRHEPVLAKPRGIWWRAWHWGYEHPLRAFRLLAVALVALVVQGHFVFVSRETPVIHVVVLGVFCLWGLITIAIPHWVSQESLSQRIGILVVVADFIFSTILLAIFDAVESPLMASYILLLLFAGLTMQRKLVKMTFGLALLGYGILLARAYWIGKPPQHLDWLALGIVMLIVSSLIVYYWVDRIRALRRFTEQRM